MYIAHAVSTGRPVPWVRPPEVPKLDSHALQVYTEVLGNAQYDKYKWLPGDYPEIDPFPEDPPPAVHSAYHDAESVYWVLAVFLLCALPKGCEQNKDDNQEAFSQAYWGIHGGVVGTINDSRFTDMPRSTTEAKMKLHTGLAMLSSFFNRMTQIIDPEYLYLKLTVPFDHLHESMQQLLLEQVFAMADNNIPLDTKTRCLLPCNTNEEEPHTASGIKRATADSKGS